MDELNTEWEVVGGRSDEEEIGLRRDRASRENLACRQISGPSPLFADYAVWHCDRENSTRYGVEIRSLDEGSNWCECPDFQKSGLGVCKHVFFVLNREDVAAYSKTGATSPFVEVFLDADRGPCVTVPDDAGAALVELIRNWISDRGRLLSPWQHTLGQFLQAVDVSSPDLRKKFRVSKGVRDLVGSLGRRQRREALRRQTEGVLRRMGARHLIGRDLTAIQTAGMLHLAFAGRAVLGDASVHKPDLQALAAGQLLRERGEARRVLVIVPTKARCNHWQQIITDGTESSVSVGLDACSDSAAAYTVALASEAAERVHAVNDLLAPDLIIVDDAGACCPLKSEQTRNLKRLRSTNLFALYDADLADDPDTLYSVVDWVEPALLGSLFRFNREFCAVDGKAIQGELVDREALLDKVAAVWLPAHPAGNRAHV